MKTTPFTRDRSPAFASSSLRLVVYCEGVADESVLRFLSRIPEAPGLDVHIVGGSERRNRQNLTVRVLRPFRPIQGSGNRLSVVESDSAQLLLAKCGPGSVHELLARYCARIAANLIIVATTPASRVARWWTASLAERLARHFPVLAIPAEDSSVPFGMERRLR